MLLSFPKVLGALALFFPFVLLAQDVAEPVSEAESVEKTAPVAAAPAKRPFDPNKDSVSIMQLVQGEPDARYHPDGLETLLQHLNDYTSMNVNPEPVFIQSFEDERLLDYPVCFVNFADRQDWTFSDKEADNLRVYLERGGFLFIDAGINTEFLAGDPRYGQFHSFADWKVSPVIEESFRKVFPAKQFKPVERNHAIFRSFFAGLPDPSILPDTVRDYVIQEKWPQGTYSLMGLEVNDHLGVVCSPVISMGWGKNRLGNWSSYISFRIRAASGGLSERLENAAVPGRSFKATREDGQEETIFCEQEAMPAWVKEPDGKYRIFSYYGSREISDYAHVYFTRLGINIFTYAVSN
jgi:hypothetical protein